MKIIADLLEHPSSRPVAPAGDPEIDAVARLFGATLPEVLVKFWQASDGLFLDSLDAHLLGPSEILEIVRIPTFGPDLVQAGFVPLLDDHESNYLAVTVREPLAFRIAHIPHDDGSRLLYTDVESCLRALLEAATTFAVESVDEDEDDDREFFQLSGTEGDYAPTSMRSEEDHRVARSLMALTREDLYWHYAAQLLDARNLPDWEILLETNHFVRRDVLDRMRRMDSPNIRDLLRRDEENFAEFVRLFSDAALEAGLEIGERHGSVLRINSQWIQLEAFFYRRSVTRAIPLAVAWIEDGVNGRDPRLRDPNFFTEEARRG